MDFYVDPQLDVTLTAGRPQSDSPDHANDLSTGSPLIQVHNQGDFTDGASCSTLDNTPALIPFGDRQPDFVYDGVSDDAPVPVLSENATDTSHDHIPALLTALHQSDYEQMNDEELFERSRKAVLCIKDFRC